MDFFPRKQLSHTMVIETALFLVILEANRYGTLAFATNIYL